MRFLFLVNALACFMLFQNCSGADFGVSGQVTTSSENEKVSEVRYWISGINGGTSGILGSCTTPAREVRIMISGNQVVHRYDDGSCKATLATSRDRVTQLLDLVEHSPRKPADPNGTRASDLGGEDQTIDILGVSQHRYALDMPYDGREILITNEAMREILKSLFLDFAATCPPPLPVCTQ